MNSLQVDSTFVDTEMVGIIFSILYFNFLYLPYNSET